MSEDTTAVASQADATGASLAPQEGDRTSTTSQVDESQNKTTKSADDYERMIAELRKENANHRTKLKKFEEEVAKQEEARLSKEQLLEKQLNELKAEHNDYVEAQFEQMIDREIALQAAKLGVDPAHLDRVSRFLEWEEIEIDEETGNPTNIHALVEQLVKDMPGLKAKGTQAPTSGGATNPPRSQSSAPAQLSWTVIGKMTPTEYNARRDEIQQWMQENTPRFR